MTEWRDDPLGGARGIALGLAVMVPLWVLVAWLVGVGR